MGCQAGINGVVLKGGRSVNDSTIGMDVHTIGVDGTNLTISIKIGEARALKKPTHKVKSSFEYPR